MFSLLGLFSGKAYSLPGSKVNFWFFLHDGENMLANPASFSSAQLLAHKDKYDAYNNTHGEALYF